MDGADHVNPTAPHRTEAVADEGAAGQIRCLRRNCADFGIELVDPMDPRQGVEHVVVMWWTALFPSGGEMRWTSKTPPYGSQRWA